MKLASIEQICPETPAWITECEKLKSESTLAGMVLISLQMGLWLARAVLESEIRRRAEGPSEWGTCLKCGHKHRSKGWRTRQIETMVGRIYWKRRVGHCPKGCKGSLSVPLDEALGIAPHQGSSEELMRLGCLLSVMMPYRSFDKMNFYTTYGACQKSQDTVDSVFFKIVKTPVIDNLPKPTTYCSHAILKILLGILHPIN